jgi:hypothetical protein
MTDHEDVPYQQMRQPLLTHDTDAEIIRQRNEDMAKLGTFFCASAHKFSSELFHKKTAEKT